MSKPLDEQTFTASEALMLMLDCGTKVALLYHEIPQFRMQADFILTSKETTDAKRLAFHSVLLNTASEIVSNYVKQKDGNEQKAQTDRKKQEDIKDGKTQN